MADLRRIGDELHYDGQLVAVLAVSGIAPSALGAFTDALDAGFVDEEAKEELKEELETASYTAVMTDLMHNLKPFARGGLVKLTDVENIVNQLKEEKGLE
jgi:hypothetical protein